MLEITMSDHDSARRAASSDERREATAQAGFETVESYEVDDGIVLYDAESPLAWVRTDSPIRLDRRV
jgi:hypothetical protein